MKLDTEDDFTRLLLAEGAHISQRLVDLLRSKGDAFAPNLGTLLALLFAASTLYRMGRQKALPLPPFEALAGFLFRVYQEGQGEEVAEAATADAPVDFGDKIPVAREVEALKRMSEKAVVHVPKLVDAAREALRGVPRELRALAVIEAAVVFAKLAVPGGPPPMTEEAWEMATTMLWNGVEVEAIVVGKETVNVKGGDA